MIIIGSATQAAPPRLPAAGAAGAELARAAREATALWARLLDDRGAMATYARQQRSQLMVALMERAGVPFDHVGLAALVRRWRAELTQVEADARRLISGATGRAALLNLQSAAQVADVVSQLLTSAELEAWPRTPGGALRTDSATLKRSKMPFAAGVYIYIYIYIYICMYIYIYIYIYVYVRVLVSKETVRFDSVRF